jgi:dTDP-4-dehydrorhamnose reductase
MLAGDLIAAASESGYQVIGLSHQELDVTQADQVRAAMEQFRPDVVVHTPAITVDACEDNPEEGFRLHAWSAGLLARHCQRMNATLVYISSCGVFGDEVKFYSEYDQPQPKTHYARSKLLGEQLAGEACERTFIIRPGWLFGGAPTQQRNFVYQRYREAQQKSVMPSANDKFGCPTWTRDLSAKILEILETDEYGLYHVTNQGCASRYDYVQCIVESFGLDAAVEPVDSSAFPRRAQVPNCELLDNLNMKFLGVPLLRSWQEAIQSYVHTLAIVSHAK